MAVSQREMRRRERNRRQLISRILWGALAVVAVIALGYFGLQLFKVRPGSSVPVMATTQHIEIDEQHEPYNSDPPTSGSHYAQPAEAGFYDVALPDEQLVHNLEHGYVVIWYNCTGLEETVCESFKEKIRGVMGQAGTVGLSSSKKLIAVPRLSLPGSIAATTWGRLYQPETFDPDELLAFIKEFRNKAPEPNAP